MCVKQYVVPYRYVTFACSSPVVSQFTDLARKVKHDMCVSITYYSRFSYGEFCA